MHVPSRDVYYSISWQEDKATSNRLLVSCLRPRSPKPAASYIPVFRLTYSCACSNQRPHDDIRKRSLSKMLLSITISVSLGPSLLPWTIIEVNEDTYTFEALFTSIQGGRFNAVTISEDLKSARLLRSLVGQSTAAVVIEL